MENLLHSGNNNKFFRQLLFLIFLIAIGLIIFKQLQFFVGSLLGAFTLYMIFRNLNFRLTEKWNWPHWIAGLALTALCFGILSLLGYLMFKVIAAEIPAVDASKIFGWIMGLGDRVNEIVGFNAVPKDVIQKSGGLITKFLSGILNTTYSFAVNILMMLVIVYFMFTGGRWMECYAFRYIPYKGRSLHLLRSEVRNMIFSNAVGIPLILAAQMLVACFIYWLTGVDNFIFWGFLTAICGLVPLVGTGLVYVPMAIYYAVSGDLLTGIIIAAYGVLVISNADNVIRIVLMKKVSDTHPLIVIFGVILGIPLFGFWGIIFGPLFISAFLLLIKIYYVEYGLLTDQEEAETLATTPPVCESPPPARSIHDLHGMKALRSLKTVRPERSSKRGKTTREEQATKNK